MASVHVQQTCFFLGMFTFFLHGLSWDRLPIFAGANSFLTKNRLLFKLILILTILFSRELNRLA